MDNQNGTKQQKKLGSEDSGRIARYRKREIRNMNFQRVEEAPLNAFEREVQEKIAVEPSPLEVMIREEQLGLLQKAIVEAGDLTSLERVCIQLALDGCSQVQIAKRLGLATRTVRKHSRQAIEKLKDCLKG